MAYAAKSVLFLNLSAEVAFGHFLTVALGGMEKFDVIIIGVGSGQLGGCDSLGATRVAYILGRESGRVG